jgi:hypothetical protein
MTFSITELSIMTLGTMTLGITKLGITTLGITKLGLTTLGIASLIAKPRRTDTLYNNTKHNKNVTLKIIMNMFHSEGHNEGH